MRDSRGWRGWCCRFLALILLAGGAAASAGVRADRAEAGSGPPPNPLVSRDIPAFASDDCDGAYPARLANNANYADYWRSCKAPPSEARPVWLAYDLSGLPAARRGQILVAWYNDPMTVPYDHTLIGDQAYNIPRDYMIEANAAPGGPPPVDGWQSLVAVAGNTYHSRQHVLDLAGKTWIRLRATAADGSSLNGDIALNLDIHDASRGLEDDWIFFGDSISADAMGHGGAMGSTFAEGIAARSPGSFPAQENGGVGFLTSTDGARLIGRWLPLFPGRYVALNFGTNDANNTAAGDPSVADAFSSNYAAMIEAIVAAGKIPIVPTIPWGRSANIQANAPALNARIAELATLYPQLLRGPDLWNYFREHQDLIGADNVHPTAEGSRAYRERWVEWAATTVYAGGPPTRCFPQTGRCVSERFYAYWELHGALAINGYPISDVFTETLEDGTRHQVQYFERVRFEYHRENADPQFQVLLGQFGRRLHPPDPPVVALPDATYFAQTGHNVGRVFLDFWQANGGLAQFGFPLSEEITETLEDGKPYTVQYFERARFELHPENADPHYQVLLGQFGRRMMPAR